MVAYAKQTVITPQEYLAWERKAKKKSEYHDGVIVGMAGASEEHNTLTFNIVTELGPQLKGKDCRGYAAYMRVSVPQCHKYFYPDISVVCKLPQFEDAELDTLLNPTLLIEVLSPSTEKTDSGEKFDCYRTLDSLKTYILVAQQEPRIEVYTRQEDGSWRYDTAKGMDGTLTLPAIGCTLKLADIYARVIFPLVNEEENKERD